MQSGHQEMQRCQTTVERRITTANRCKTHIKETIKKKHIGTQFDNQEMQRDAKKMKKPCKTTVKRCVTTTEGRMSTKETQSNHRGKQSDHKMRQSYHKETQRDAQPYRYGRQPQNEAKWHPWEAKMYHKDSAWGMRDVSHACVSLSRNLSLTGGYQHIAAIHW